MNSKLPTSIMVAVALYYLHRQSHNEYLWDKDKDLEYLLRVAKADGWTVEEVAGNFWFSRPSLLGTVIVKVTENNYLTCGDSNVSGGLTAHGLFGRILEMVRRN